MMQIMQTTVQNHITSKAPIANPTFTGTVTGITKAMVGLGNVDNTADANKPISTATEGALDAKGRQVNHLYQRRCRYTVFQI